MRRLSLVASWRHYLEHLAPVWHALPAEVRGHVRVTSYQLEAEALKLGLEPVVLTARQDEEEALLVAGWADGRHVDVPLALLEHGAGQSYKRRGGTVHGSYSGGAERDHVGLFLCTSETVARRNRAAYPDARMAVVGAPHLDRFHRAGRSPGAGPHSAGPPSIASRGSAPAVAVTFHWNAAGISPEGKWAFPYYKQALPALVEWADANGVTLLGHGHPRAEHRLRKMWERLGVEWATWAEVLERADVLVVDNSSIAVEAMSIGTSVVWLSIPSYRRDVHHGGRFWNWLDAGEHVQEPTQLVPAVAHALTHPQGRFSARQRVVVEAYAYRDGKCAARAAAAILDWLTTVG